MELKVPVDFATNPSGSSALSVVLIAKIARIQWTWTTIRAMTHGVNSRDYGSVGKLPPGNL